MKIFNWSDHDQEVYEETKQAMEQYLNLDPETLEDDESENETTI